MPLPTPLPTIGPFYDDHGPCPNSDLRRSHGTGEERVAEARHSCKFQTLEGSATVFGDLGGDQFANIRREPLGVPSSSTPIKRK